MKLSPIKTFAKRLCGTLKRHKRAILVSCCNVLLLTIFSYFLNNQFLFTGEELLLHALNGYAKDRLGLEEEQRDDGVVFINVGYDNKLIDFYNDNELSLRDYCSDTLYQKLLDWDDKYSTTLIESFEKAIEPLKKNDERRTKLGNTEIVDRSKLIALLRKLEEWDNYKYICLDVLFEKGYEDSANDSLLFSQIKKMRNIVIPYADIDKLSDSCPLDKVAYAEHFTTIVATNFVRYPLTDDNRPSIAAYPYYDLTGNSIKKHNLFYTCNGKLCYNSVFLDFPINSSSKKEELEYVDKEGYQNYYNLGTELLEGNELNDALTNGKYIYIGDFVNQVDMHDTYAGKRPGVLINYYAFKAMMEGKHFYSWSLALFLGLVYFLISLTFFSDKTLSERIPFIRKCKSRFLHFLLSLIGYGVILLIIEILLNLFADISVSILMPTIYFAVFKNIVKFKTIRT